MKTVSLVSKRFYDIVADSTKLMKNILLKQTYAVPIREFEDMISQSKRKYENFWLQYSEYGSTSLNTWRFLATKPVKYLKLSEVTLSEKILVKILKLVANSLESLEIKGVTLESRLRNRKAVVVNFTRLKHFKYAGFFKVFDYFPDSLQFETLNIRHCDGCDKFSIGYCHPDRNTLISLINKQDNLKTLKLRCWGYYNYDKPTVSFNNQFNVECLHIRQIQCDFFLESLTSASFPFIKTLELGVEDLSVAEESEIIKKMETLEQLSVFYLSNNLLSTISQYNKKIKCLEFTMFKEGEKLSIASPNVTKVKLGSDVEFKTLFEIFVNMEELEIDTLTEINENQFKGILLLGRNLKIFEIRNGCELSATTFESMENLLGNLKILRIYRMREISAESNNVLVKMLNLRSYICKKAKTEDARYYPREN